MSAKATTRRDREPEADIPIEMYPWGNWGFGAVVIVSAIGFAAWCTALVITIIDLSRGL